MTKKISILLLSISFLAIDLIAAPTPFESVKLIVDQKMANLDALKPQVAEAIGKHQATMTTLTQQRSDIKQKIQAANADLKSTKVTLQQQTDTAENDLKSALNALDKASASDADKTVAQTTRMMATSKMQSHNQSMGNLNKIDPAKQIAD